MTNSNFTLSAGSLREGLKTLPQEIYDLIHQDVFTAAPGSRIVSRPSTDASGSTTVSTTPAWGQVTELRQNLVLLHVSRATRALYAKTFYGRGEVFELHFDNYIVCRETTAWLESITQAHRDLLARVEIFPSLVSDSTRYLVKRIQRYRRGIETEFNSSIAQTIFIRHNGLIYG